MTIVYKRDYRTDEEITEQQALLSESYDKIFIEGDTIKRIEFYENGIMNYVRYHIMPGENIASILEEWLPRTSKSAVSIVESIEPLGSYFLERDREYKTVNEVGGLSRTLYDNQNRIICFEESKINAPNVIDHNNTEKYYYYTKTMADGSVVQYYARFSYKANGEFSFLENYLGEDDIKGYKEILNEEGTTIQKLLDWLKGTPDLGYYQTAILEPS